MTSRFSRDAFAKIECENAFAKIECEDGTILDVVGMPLLKLNVKMVQLCRKG